MTSLTYELFIDIYRYVFMQQLVIVHKIKCSTNKRGIPHNISCNNK